jgi:hypothetical protein
MVEVRIRSLKKYWATMALGALAISAVLMLVSASPAAAYSTGYHQFCWGVVEGNNGFCDSLNHDGQAGYATEVAGSGANHSVCVEARNSDGIRMCSGGPNQGVYNYSPSGYYVSIPNITNNATGNNTVYASAFYCATPGC